MADMKLPPGATLAPDQPQGMKLPPGATLVSQGTGGPPPPAAAPETAWYDKQLVHPETWFDDAKDADAHSVGGGLRHVAHGLLQSAGAMTTPKNLAFGSVLAAANSIPVVGELADAYALSNGLISTGKEAKQAYDQHAAGNDAAAEETLGNLIPGVVGTAAGARGVKASAARLKGLPVIRPSTGGGLGAPVTAATDLLGNPYVK